MVPELETPPRLRPMRLRRGPGDDLPLLRVELVEQAPVVEVERASRALLRGSAAGAVVEAPPGGPAGHGAAQVGEEVARRRLPAAVAPAERLLVMHRDRPADRAHRREALAGPGLGLAGRSGLPRPMGGDEIEADRQQRLSQVGLVEVVAPERGRDQPLRVEPPDLLAECLELLGRHVPRIADVPLVGQVEVPVAMPLQRADERLDGPPVGLEVRDGSPIRPVAARERDVHDQPAAVALGHQPL